MIEKLKNFSENKSLFLYFLFLIFFFILVFSLIDSVKLRLNLENIKREVNKKVEKEMKWYEENIRILNKEIDKYRRLYQEAEREANYYRNIYKQLQLDKEKIELPKSSKELRERFRKLGYEPIS